MKILAADEHAVVVNTDKNGVPWCTEEKCPQYDGKRCRLIGFRPSSICEPSVIEMAKRLAGLRKQKRKDE